LSQQYETDGQIDGQPLHFIPTYLDVNSYLDINKSTMCLFGICAMYRKSSADTYCQ